MPRIQDGISWWAWSSLVAAFGYCALLLFAHYDRPIQGEAIYNLSMISWSSFLFMGSSLWLGRQLYANLVVITNVLATAWVIYFSFIQPAFLPAAIVTALTVGVFTLWTGWMYLKSRRSKSRLDWGLIIAFLALGFHALDYPILRPIESIAMLAMMLCILLSLAINIILSCIVITQFKSSMINSEKHAISKSMEDPLTGLTNRAGLVDAFNKRIYSVIPSTEVIVLVFADLDNFKYINDNFGHKDGDAVLRSVANRIQSITRQHDIAVRLGGDEFVVLLTGIKPNKQAERIHQFRERLIENIRRPIKVNKEIHQVGLSCGVAVYGEDGDDLDSLLHFADHSMYQDKRSKKGTKARKRSAIKEMILC